MKKSIILFVLLLLFIFCLPCISFANECEYLTQLQNSGYIQISKRSSDKMKFYKYGKDKECKDIHIDIVCDIDDNILLVNIVSDSICLDNRKNIESQLKYLEVFTYKYLMKSLNSITNMDIKTNKKDYEDFLKFTDILFKKLPRYKDVYKKYKNIIHVTFVKDLLVANKNLFSFSIGGNLDKYWPIIQKFYNERSTGELGI
jgi:hypothetical protein